MRASHTECVSVVAPPCACSKARVPQPDSQAVTPSWNQGVNHWGPGVNGLKQLPTIPAHTTSNAQDARGGEKATRGRSREESIGADTESLNTTGLRFKARGCLPGTSRMSSQCLGGLVHLLPLHLLAVYLLLRPSPSARRQARNAETGVPRYATEPPDTLFPLPPKSVPPQCRGT